MNLKDALENLSTLTLGQLKFTKQLAKMTLEHMGRSIEEAKQSTLPERDEAVLVLETDFKLLTENSSKIDALIVEAEKQDVKNDSARRGYLAGLDERQQWLLLCNEIKKIAERVMLQAELQGFKFPRLVRISMLNVGEDRSRDVSVYIVAEDDKAASAQAQAEISANAKAAVDAVLNEAPAK